MFGLNKAGKVVEVPAFDELRIAIRGRLGSAWTEAARAEWEQTLDDVRGLPEVTREMVESGPDWRTR